MKRITGLVVLLAIVVGGIFYFQKRAAGPSVLHLCTWSNYYPDAILEEFTKKTNIKLQVSFISSNEELFAKLKAGAAGFDVIQPSDYMIRQMAALQMLTPLDHGALTNINHLDEFYTKVAYDPGNKFSVPFTWGTTGIAINTKKLQVPKEGVSWKMLTDATDPKHTSLLDDMREVFSLFLIQKGVNPNIKDMTELGNVKKSILATKDKVLMFSSEPKPLLLRDELHLAHIYSVDAIQAHIEKPEIEYFIPKEGAVIWTDNFAIPKTTLHSKEAHTFINYFLDPDNALKIITTNHLPTPNKTAKAKLPPEVLKNPGLYPGPDVMKRLYFLDDLGDTMTTVNEMWTELKS